jgi:muconolactone delta-isomerase
MKYLAISEMKDSFFLLPMDKQDQIKESSIAFVDKYRASGKCRHVYYTSDLKGTVSIWEVDSSEEAARLMTENPQVPFADVSVQPLIEYEVGKRASREAHERMFMRV